MKLIYSSEELLAHHPYVRVQEELGRPLHGGFNEQGRCVSPRTLYRSEAIKNWRTQLRERGYAVLDESKRVLECDSYPNAAQHKFLLLHGLSQSLFNALTVTGITEAKGEILAGMSSPDFQKIIVEDISETALGHLNKGLMKAHGLDEGGEKEKGIGGHDEMWFAIRDLLFPDSGFPLVEPGPGIFREGSGREMPQIPEMYEAMLSLFVNVLMIEYRAEKFFSICQSLFLDKELFTDKREQATKAAEIVERIRRDESPHVAYLETIISEFRSFTVKTLDGKQLKGSEVIDGFIETMVRWHSDELLALSRKNNQKEIEARIVAINEGESLLTAFRALNP